MLRAVALDGISAGRRLLRWLSAVTAALLLLAGCGGHVTDLAFPTPPSSSPALTTTGAPDLTGAKLAGVPGESRSTVAVGPGGATLNGTVVAPSGTVGGADVHIERLVGNQVGAMDVVAQADGTWSLPRVLGGRYRVRAWRPPDLSLINPEIFFLNGTDTMSLTLELQQFNASTVSSAIAPKPPVVDQPAALAVELTTQTVDAQGVVRAQPVANANIELSAGGVWTIAGPNPAVTGADGTVSWNVVCGQPGPQPLTAVVDNTDTYSVKVPACALPPPVATTVPTTSTTAPGPPGSNH
jgi:hypothetical protein